MKIQNDNTKAALQVVKTVQLFKNFDCFQLLLFFGWRGEGIKQSDKMFPKLNIYMYKITLFYLQNIETRQLSFV